MAGRPIRGTFRQDEVRKGMALLGTIDGCDAKSRPVMKEGLRCEVWDRCTSGRTLSLCLFDGGHEMIGDWVTDIHRWLASLSPAR